jgi:xanthine dehydrogenase/oxidase
VDATEALNVPGVVDFITASDIPNYRERASNGHAHDPNMIGPVFHGIFCDPFHVWIDEELFATKKVYFFGQTLGLMVAQTREIAQKAIRKVKVVYERLPSVFTMEVR